MTDSSSFSACDDAFVRRQTELAGVDDRAKAGPIDKSTPAPTILNLSMDGTGIPMRGWAAVGRTG